MRLPPAAAARQPPHSATASPVPTSGLDVLAEGEDEQGGEPALEADDRRDDGEVSAVERAEEEEEAADLEHAREHGERERRRSSCPGRPSTISASGSVQMPLPTRISSDAMYGSIERLSGTSQ